VVSEADLLPAQKIELEWELGVTPGETSGDGASPFLPRWVLPNVGDRVWTEGHWVFDCGHGKKIGGEFIDVNGIPVLFGAVEHFRTEIHPGRAVASMRPQAGTLPGTGTTPVPVTATDLYIHGRGAFMVQQLECGIDIILVVHEPCSDATSIDELYSFEVCLPPKPAPFATLSSKTSRGPDDSGIGADPVITKATAAGGCLLPSDEYGNSFDTGTMLEVTVDLRGTGISPDDVYSRQIVSGWVYPQFYPLPHLSASLTLLDLHDDYDLDPSDGELTFWWMGLDRAPIDEWHRLVNHEIPTSSNSELCFEHTNHLNDMDDDFSCGDGLLEFSGPNWDFYLRHGQSLNVHTTGYDQDCLDDYFGSGIFEILQYVNCYTLGAFALEAGGSDPIQPMDLPLVPAGGLAADYLGERVLSVDDFDFHFTLAEIPLTDEDSADLAVTKTCEQTGEVALAGEPVTCTIVVSNNGPGLPRNVILTDAISTTLAASDYSVGTASFRYGTDATNYLCGSSSATGFRCALGSIPVGGYVTIQVNMTAWKPGNLTNTATATTESVDIDVVNNQASARVEIYLPVQVDVQPGSTTGAVNVGRRGQISVAILSDASFDASALQIATACFGDAETPGDRSCTESHGGPHINDVDRDRDRDLLFHFSVEETGIDAGDTTACLKGTLTDGTGFYGCDAIRALP